MKNAITITARALTMIVMLGLSATANAEAVTAYVATVLGEHAYNIQNGGSQLYFQPQPDTAYAWTDSVGNALTYTYTNSSGTHTAVRDGMKTYAVTNAGYGQALSGVKLEFDFYAGADPNTGYTMAAPGISVKLTDGNGNYANWQVSQGGTPYTTAAIAGETGWYHLTLDCAGLTDDSHNGKINNYIGNASAITYYTGTTDRPMWSSIKSWTLAGFYDADTTAAGVPNELNSLGASVLSQSGIVLFWGDTVGGMNGDGNGEIGGAAERAQGQAGKLIKDMTVTVGGVTYDATFTAAVPEPATFALLFGGAIALGAYCSRRRVK